MHNSSTPPHSTLLLRLTSIFPKTSHSSYVGMAYTRRCGVFIYFLVPVMTLPSLYTRMWVDLVCIAGVATGTGPSELLLELTVWARPTVILSLRVIN